MKAFDLEADIKIDIASANASLDTLISKARQLNGELNSTPSVNGLGGGVTGNSGTNSGINALEEANQKTIGGFFSNVASVTIGNLAASAVDSLIQAIKSGVQEGYQYTLSKESYVATFRSLLGGTQEDAESFYSMLQNLAVKTPLDIGDMAHAAQLFLSNGEAAENIDEILMMLADLSLGDSEKFGRIALAMSQIKSYGVLRAQERNQLVEAGIDIYGLLAESYGLEGTREENVATLVKKQENKEIPYSDVLAAVQKAVTTGNYAGGAAYKMDTLGGSEQRMKEMRAQYLGAIFDESGLDELAKARNNIKADMYDVRTRYYRDWGLFGYKQWGKAESLGDWLDIVFAGKRIEEEEKEPESVYEIMEKFFSHENYADTAQEAYQNYLETNDIEYISDFLDHFYSPEEVDSMIQSAIQASIPPAIAEGFKGAKVQVTVGTGNVVLDSGTLVGALTPKVNVSLGGMLGNA